MSLTSKKQDWLLKASYYTFVTIIVCVLPIVLCVIFIFNHMFYVQLSVGAVLVVVSLSSAPQFCYFVCFILLSLVYIANYYISKSTSTDSDLAS